MLNKISIIIIFSLLLTFKLFCLFRARIGGGVIAATIGIIFAIVAFIFGILWFPIKRLINKYKKDKEKKIIQIIKFLFLNIIVLGVFFIF